MGKSLLCGRCQAEHLLRRMVAATENAADFRFFASQCPGLIEEHGVHLAHLFKCAAIRIPVPHSELITASAALGSAIPAARVEIPSAGTTARSAKSSPRDCEFNL